MNARMASISLACMVVMAGPAVARDRTGYQAIAAGNYARAEQSLLAERRIFPDRPELMLNLAAVYRETGRPDAARALYRAVLARGDVVLDLPNGNVASSRALAQAGLARLPESQQLSAR